MNPSENNIVRIINQFFELEKKISKRPEPSSLLRNIRRIKSGFEDMGYFLQNPLGESYDETRTDCEASIAGETADKLVIVEVIKPIIYRSEDGSKQIVQRGVVIAESK